MALDGIEPFAVAGAVLVVVPPEFDGPEPFVAEGVGVGEPIRDGAKDEDVMFDLPPPHAIKREVVTHST
jgi:hypothetical protein